MPLADDGGNGNSAAPASPAARKITTNVAMRFFGMGHTLIFYCLDGILAGFGRIGVSDREIGKKGRLIGALDVRDKAIADIQFQYSLDQCSEIGDGLPSKTCTIEPG
jgi:hypothetical protein